MYNVCFFNVIGLILGGIMKNCKFKLSKNLGDIENYIRKIDDNLNILEDYCNYNLENKKICPILGIIEQLKLYIGNIQKHF